ncbi:MAG: YeeE/YedE family protein [Candidatus Binatia bacterium]
MNIWSAMDFIDERNFILAGGLLIGSAFGYFAQISGFCIRSAVCNLVSGNRKHALVTWVLAAAVTLATVQVLVAIGSLELSSARQLAARGTMSGAVFGGLLLGVGIVIARGCPSRLLVLFSQGNLRALLTLTVIAASVSSATNGALTPLTVRISELWMVEGGPSRDLASLLGLETAAKLAIASLLFIGAVALARISKLPFTVCGPAIVIGVLVTCAWYFTYTATNQGFELLYPSGISLSGPLGKLFAAVHRPAGSWIGFDGAIVPGVLLGGFLAAVSRRKFSVEGVRDLYSVSRCLVGGVMIGLGSVLAGGCSIGTGLTGTSILSATSWTALAAMVSGIVVSQLTIQYRQTCDPRSEPKSV